MKNFNGTGDSKHEETDSEVFPRYIETLENSVESLSSELDRIHESSAKSARFASLLKEYHLRLSCIQDDCKLPGALQQELENVLGAFQNRNFEVEAEASRISESLFTAESVEQRYRQAILGMKMRKDISRLRSCLHIRHPCGEIILTSSFHRLYNLRSSSQFSVPESHSWLPNRLPRSKSLKSSKRTTRPPPS